MIENINTTTAATASTASDATRIRTAAQQFEALLIGELLKSSREAGSSGWLGTGDEDEAGQTGIEVGEQEFARMLAANGGLGLSKSIEAGLRQDASLERK